MGKSILKHRGWTRILTLVLAFAMLAAYVPAVGVARAADAETPAGTYVLEASALDAFDTGAKADGDLTTAGTDDFFTLIWRSNSRVDSSNSTFEDGYTTGMRINFQGSGADLESGAVRFTTTSAATVKIWWTLGGDGREMTILNSAGETVATTTDGAGAASGTRTISTIEMEAGGTYYLGGAGANSYICKVEVTPAAATYVLEASALDAFDTGAKADGETTAAGADDFFTLIWRSNSRVDSSNSTFEDGYTTGMRINFQGSGASLEGGAVRFTTTAAATVKIWWTLGGDGREMTILDSTGETVATTTEGTGAASGTRTISTIELEEGGTYYLGGAGANNYICKVEVTTGGGARPERAPWADVAAPAITGVALAENDDNTINVTVAGEVGYDAADRITVTMTAPDGTTADQSSSREGTEHTVSFAPGDSGTYTFSAVATREGEEEAHTGARTVDFEFTFPLTAPVIKGAYNDGNGAMTVEWNSVHEADSYNVTAGELSQNVTGLTAAFEGLAVGEEVTFTVAAVRGEEVGPESAITATVSADAEQHWAFSAFGNSTNTANNDYSGSFGDGEVRVWSKGGRGKIQEESHDGIAFYYTAIDPETTNFVLEATGHVNEWSYSNGQEAFGLAALDRVGVHGSADTGAIFYNNSYMTAVTRLSYDGVNMRQGVGAIEQYGTNLENYANPEGDGFTKSVTTLEYSFQGQGGTHNLVGNATNPGAITGTIDEPLVDFRLRLEKNNTGYFMTYLVLNEETGEYDVVETRKTYNPENLTVLDDMVYIGFFAARNFDVTFTDITLTFTDPADDASAEERPAEYIEPSYGFSDRGVSNSPEGELIYRGSVDGVAVITDASGKEFYNGPVTANRNLFVDVALTEGENVFTVTVTPNADFHPDGLSYRYLTSYETVTLTRTITYKADSRTVIYVAPNGSADADGATKETPTTLAAAVAAPAPGTKIVLLAGEYSIGSLTISRGINGTEDAMILLTADEGVRPVLNGGITLEANYWRFYGFDVTKSSGTGIHVAGSCNIVERVNTYANGNTGLQISRQGSFDGIAEWPSYNLILNCSSWLNADPGYEDADGFAAKLTVGEGNVFDGCISAYNADDGWDLFARGESIGTVTIKNSIAFKNGWVLDENGSEVNAGNGNGFKMGGSGYEGGHTLINSVSFANKANGITCNSCPDIKVYNSTSFDNGGANLTVYSSITGQSTDFAVKGYISFGTSVASKDSISPAGAQTVDELYGAANYYFDGTVSSNAGGKTVADNWFVHLDADRAIYDRELGIGRNEDGSINMNGFLALTDKAPTDAGARLSAAEWINIFNDVSEDDWFGGDVAFVVQNGLMIGVGNRKFNPGGTTTRGMLMTILARMAGVDTSGSAPWYQAGVEWAMQKGVSYGNAPEDNITREQFVTMLYRYAGVTEAAGDLSSYSDAGNISGWAAGAMAWGIRNGIVQGNDNKLNPQGTASRAEAAAMLARFCQNIEK